MDKAQKWVAEQFGGPEVLTEVQVEVPTPATGEVTIAVRASGMNPADYKGLAAGDPAKLPVTPGYEVAGVLTAVGPDTEIASGGGVEGDEVLAFRISGGYATAVTVAARNVFAKPAGLGFPEAANLLLAGSTAAEMLHVTGVGEGDTVVLHGAAGAVGVSVLQQARLIGVHVIGTAGEHSFDRVRSFGGEPVAYGDGLEDRIRQAAPGGVAAALDAVGTDEAVDVSLALVADRTKIVSIAAFGRADHDGFKVIGGMMADSGAFRDGVRSHLIDLAAQGKLVVPMAATYPLAEARRAVGDLRHPHLSGKLALVTGS